MLDPPEGRQSRGRQVGPTGSRPPTESRQGQGLDTRRVCATRDAAAPADGGVAEAGLEEARGAAHGVSPRTARLSGALDGGEWWRGGGATREGGGRRRAPPRGLQREGERGLRARIGRG